MRPRLSLDERKAALVRLKAKTKCKDCGEVGHWVGDPECKKGGKGKPKTGMMASVAFGSVGSDSESEDDVYSNCDEGEYSDCDDSEYDDCAGSVCDQHVADDSPP